MPPGTHRQLTLLGPSVFQAHVRPDHDEARSSTATVHCSGELDLATAPMLTACVQRQCAAGRRTVRLDLTKLRFCDARGLAALLQARQCMDDVGGQLVLVNAQPTLRRTLTLTGLDEVLHMTGEVVPFQRRLARVPTTS